MQDPPRPEDRPAARNLADLVRAAAEFRPDAAALLHPGRRALLSEAEQTTWSELDALVNRAASAFEAAGLAPGERIAVMLGNTPAFPVAYFGALRAGLAVVPIDTSATAEEVLHQLVDSGSRAVVAGADAAARVLEVSPRTRVTVVWVAGAATAPAGAVVFEDTLRVAATEQPLGALAAGEDLAVLAYTSGTSGRPKGAMLSHRALLADLDHVGRIVPPVAGADDVVLLVLPLTHIFGLNSGLGLVARTAATGLLLDRVDPQTTLTEVTRHAVTVVLGAPPIFEGWSELENVAESLTTVRLAISGAAAMSAAAARRLLEAAGRPVFESYGLTETAPSVTSTLMSEAAQPGSIGRPVPGVEVRLVDAGGSEVDNDDAGEICVRGANLFSGYWPDRREGPDADGWWSTGDVAVRDAAGELRLVDRRREVIVVSGFNVYPREVEQALVSHPAVAEAAVIGIPHPYTGEAVRALVVSEAGASVSGKELLAHVARRLARFKCPTSLQFVSELPHSSTGKVSKARLRESLAGEPAGVQRLAGDEPTA